VAVLVLLATSGAVFAADWAFRWDGTCDPQCLAGSLGPKCAETWDQGSTYPPIRVNEPWFSWSIAEDGPTRAWRFTTRENSTGRHLEYFVYNSVSGNELDTPPTCSDVTMLDGRDDPNVHAWTFAVRFKVEGTQEFMGRESGGGDQDDRSICKAQITFSDLKPNSSARYRALFRIHLRWWDAVMDYAGNLTFAPGLYLYNYQSPQWRIKVDDGNWHTLWCRITPNLGVSSSCNYTYWVDSGSTMSVIQTENADRGGDTNASFGWRGREKGITILYDYFGISRSAIDPSPANLAEMVAETPPLVSDRIGDVKNAAPGTPVGLTSKPVVDRRRFDEYNQKSGGLHDADSIAITEGDRATAVRVRINNGQYIYGPRMANKIDSGTLTGLRVLESGVGNNGDYGTSTLVSGRDVYDATKLWSLNQWNGAYLTMRSNSNPSIVKRFNIQSTPDVVPYDSAANPVFLQTQALPNPGSEGMVTGDPYWIHTKDMWYDHTKFWGSGQWDGKYLVVYRGQARLTYPIGPFGDETSLKIKRGVFFNDNDFANNVWVGVDAPYEVVEPEELYISDRTWPLGSLIGCWVHVWSSSTGLDRWYQIIHNHSPGETDAALVIGDGLPVEDGVRGGENYEIFYPEQVCNSLTSTELGDSLMNWTPGEFAGKKLRVIHDGRAFWYDIQTNSETAVTIASGDMLADGCESFDLYEILDTALTGVRSDVLPGDYVDVEGGVAAPDNEKRILASRLTVHAPPTASTISPVMAATEPLCSRPSGNLLYPDLIGVDMSATRVTLAGKVTAGDYYEPSGRYYIYVDDGTGRTDASGRGPGICCMTQRYGVLDMFPVGSTVVITGVKGNYRWWQVDPPLDTTIPVIYVDSAR